MKQIFTLLTSGVLVLLSLSAKAQYTQNFEGGESSLTGNCWTLSGIHVTNDPADVITGTGSLYSDPITNATTTDLILPALNVTATNFIVSLNYKLSSNLNGSSVRTIQIGLLDPAGGFTSLEMITLDKNTPVTAQNFSQAFTLASTGFRKIVFRLGGNSGDGNTRLIIDDIYTNASPLYGSGTCNSAPVAVNDGFFGPIGSAISGNVITNDSDPDAETIQSILVTGSPHGTVTLDPNGNFIFTLDPNYSGNTATFTYKLVDNGFEPATSNIATVTLNFTSPSPLPVKLLNFNASLNNNKVDLTWATATETKANYFAVERSTDGKNFSDAGMVFAYGNTTERKDYSLSDDISNLQTTVIYYRLRSVDIDGKSEYSATRVIRIAKQTGTSISILTYPNPVSNELRITIPDSWQNKNVTFEILNATGQVSKRIQNGSSQTETLNVNSLAPGLYIVRATCEGQIAQQKIVKQ